MMSVHTACGSIEQDQYTLGTTPPKCRSVELQVSPIMSVDLVRPSGQNGSYKVRTLLDSGTGTNWCHIDLLKHVQYNDLGSVIMQVQVFEGVKKKRYRYVELFYAIHGLIGTLRCFVTDQYAWFNEVDGLTKYAASQLAEGIIIDPSSPCSHDTGKKEIALILGPFASAKLRDRDAEYKFVGNLLFEPYKTGNSTGYVFSGLLPKHLNQNVIYSYRITPIIEEHLGAQGLKRGEIDFEPDFCHERYDLLQNLEFLHSKETLGVKPHE